MFHVSDNLVNVLFLKFSVENMEHCEFAYLRDLLIR